MFLFYLIFNKYNRARLKKEEFIWIYLQESYGLERLFF